MSPVYCAELSINGDAPALSIERALMELRHGRAVHVSDDTGEGSDRDQDLTS